MSDLGPMDPELLRRLEMFGRDAGRQLSKAIDSVAGGHQGFALFLFSFEGLEFTYVSNANRESMIKVCEEFIRHMRSGEASLTSEEKN